MNPVLVAGAGPVGLTMASELARYGVPVRIIDQAPARTDKSKAIAVWSRTLELFDRAGCAEALASAGLKCPAATVHSKSKLIARIPFSSVPSRFQYALLIPQSETERLVDAHLQSLGVKVERNVALTGFEARGDGVAGAVRHADGRTETIDASWLIGCDGAHSLIRHTLGKAFEGETMGMHFVLADVHVRGLDAPADEMETYWHEDGIVVLLPLAPSRYRIIASDERGSSGEPSLAEIQALVARRVGADVALFDPIWISDFSINERKVENYRAGRVFLAGDAAHVHSPAGGQGMNTGMQDAFNLAWKLALVTRGSASADLLESYSAERSAVARQILDESGRLTRIAMVQSHIAQDIRNFIAHRVLGFADAQHAIASQLSETAIGYPESPLNAGSAHGLAGPAPGRRIIAETPFGAGNSPRFALMAGESTEARALIGRHAALLEPDLRSPPDANGVWLVRPDGYVAAVARAGDWGPIEASLARIAGRPD